MKKLVILSIIIFLSITASARGDKIEMITGGYVYHLYYRSTVAPEGYYYNKLDRSLIAPMFGVRYSKEWEHSYKSISIFFTENCIGKNQVGIISSIGNIETIGRFNIIYGFIGGFYTENSKDWQDEHIDQAPLVLFDCITPVVGAEFNIRYNLNGNYYISLNNMISAITHTSISFGINI